MTLLAECGTFNSRASAGSQTVSLSNFGGATPKCVILWGASGQADSEVRALAFFAFGIATSASAEFSIGNASNNGVSTSDTARRHATTVYQSIYSKRQLTRGCRANEFRR